MPRKECESEEKVQGFKAFNADWTCRDYKFEVGLTYEHPGAVKPCESGFHFCTNPLDLFSYYPPTGKFAEVEGEGAVAHDEDSKHAAKRLTIKAEVSLSHLLGIGVKFILDRVDWAGAKESNTGNQSAATNTGDQSAATNTGYRSAATNTGNQSAATNTGYRSAATNTGKEGHAASLGIEGKASGDIGCWLTIAEWGQDAEYSWHRIDVQTRKVDGEVIKANVFYQLVSGEFKEAK